MAKEKENKEKNENKRFMKDVKAELKRVTWPTSKQMVNNVTAVLTIVIVTAVLVFCLDFVFRAINKYGIDKIKENVQQKNQTQTQVVQQDNNDNQTDNTNADNNVETNQNDETDSTQNPDETVVNN